MSATSPTSPTPSGRLVRTPAGRDLELTRTFRAPIEDVWASITESERTARWFGSWTGEPGVGRTVQVRMGFEAGAEPVPMTILACEPPRRLGVRGAEAHGGWHLEAWLSETDRVTTLRFVHHLGEGVDVGSVGPGWEYYLDLLVAAREGRDPRAVAWEAYYPAQQGFYAGLPTEGAG